MSAKLRVGIIGTGFGSRVQLPAFQAHDRVAVVAVSSGQPGKARAVADRFGVPLAFDDYAELVAADLDLVSITAPPHLHRQMALCAIAAGRHVLCEKPMALSVAEAEEMLELAEARGVRHFIDHELRLNLNRRKLKALLDKGYIGRPRHAQVTLVQGGRADPSRPWDWWSDKERGGGVLGAFGSHQIDLLRHLLGEIEGVGGTLGTYVKERPDGGAARAVTADDFAACTLRFAGGAVATVMLSVVAGAGRGPRLELWGDEGMLLVDEGERLLGARGGGPLTDLTEPETRRPPEGVKYDPLFVVSFSRLVDHLVAVLLDGAEVAPAATFQDGLATQRVIDAVQAADRRGLLPL